MSVSGALAGGFAGTLAPTWTGLVFNLYADPKEQESIAIRHIPISVPLVVELQRYREVLKKYPPRHQISLK